MAKNKNLKFEFTLAGREKLSLVLGQVVVGPYGDLAEVTGVTSKGKRVLLVDDEGLEWRIEPEEIDVSVSEERAIEFKRKRLENTLEEIKDEKKKIKKKLAKMLEKEEITPRTPLRIEVNGKGVPVLGMTKVSFDAICWAADDIPPHHNPSITYCKGPPENPEGILSHGQSVRVQEGMVFNAVVTGNA